ncbi:DUF5675 family protein [Spirosoma spitsbergense]|uniref:DUF5675 family protein n=1 Tax=Spirosoma spitsbergense TaxID=431554 RepID=UPI00036D0CFD|nr:DUF5675 family protein [Spirosoma spitsbergense]
MNDLLLIDRIDRTQFATRSKLYLNSKLTTYRTLEDYTDPNGPKVYGERAIPADRYLLGHRYSPKFSKQYYTKDDKNLIPWATWAKLPNATRLLYWPHDVIWVMNVPNYEFILHHFGNFPSDTNGCTLIGSSFAVLKGLPAIADSRNAYVKYYAEVMPLIRGGGQYITYRNSF